MLRAALVLAVLAFASRGYAQAWAEPTAGDAVRAGTLGAPPEVDTSDAEAERLRERTAGELEAPIPLEPAAVAFELEVVTAQRDDIDILGIHVPQGFGAAFMIATVPICIVSLIGAVFANFGGTRGDVFLAAGCGGIGGGSLALGVTMLALAETSEDLHRRRELGSRIRRLREGLVAIGPSGFSIRF